MTLPEYVKRKGRGVIAQLSRDSGLSYRTVLSAAHGEPVSLYRTAKAISAATSGEVSIRELCEPCGAAS